jgi:hypothetical protein
MNRDPGASCASCRAAVTTAALSSEAVHGDLKRKQELLELERANHVRGKVGEALHDAAGLYGDLSRW